MYGNTIRTIRVAKNLQMKSVYQGVCSKTNAIKFEKGERMLKADRFNLLLEHLMVSMDEFLCIHSNYQPTNEEYVKYNLAKSQSNEHNMQLVDQIDAGNPIDKAQLASFNLLLAYRNHQSFDKKDLDALMNYFAELGFWTLSDLKFFANNCYVLPYQTLLGLLNEALKTISRYKYFKQIDLIVATMLANCIDIMIQNQDMKNAQTYNQQLNKMSVDVTLTGYRIISEYYDAKIDFLFMNQERGKLKLEQLLDVAKLIENQELANEIKSLIKLI